jgi:dienelactone hydrolase
MSTYDDILATVPEPAGSDISVETIDYDEHGTALQGYLARDNAIAGPRPAVIVIHDWLGVNDHVKARVEMLARLGYVALAADIYGVEDRPATPEDAPEVTKKYYGDLDLMRARAVAAHERLVAEPDVDASKIVVMGYCFGGSAALELARTGAELAGAVSFHGRLLSHEPSDASAIRARLLVLTGGADPGVPDEQVHEWQEEMRGAPAVDWDVVTYSGAMHAFAVPGTNHPPMAQYDERADRRSWQQLELFLDDVFDEQPVLV